jgi:hypothetical protein
MVSTDLITGLNLSHAMAMSGVPPTLDVQEHSLDVGGLVTAPGLVTPGLVTPTVQDAKVTATAAATAITEASTPAKAALELALEVPESGLESTASSLKPTVESKVETIVETSVVTAPPGAAQVTVTTTSCNQTSSSVTSGGAGDVDLVSGGGGLVGFTVRFGDSPISSPQRIANFVFGNDRLSMRNPRGKIQPLPRFFSRAANNSTATTLEELAAAVFADADGQQAGNQLLRRGAAALVRATSAEIRGTYLLVNSGKPRLDPAGELMIKLTGVSGRLPALGAIDPAAVFG